MGNKGSTEMKLLADIVEELVRWGPQDHPQVQEFISRAHSEDTAYGHI